MSHPELSPVVTELVGLLGQRKAFGLCRAGGVVYVPVRLNTRTRLVRMLGTTDAAKLIARWAGQQLHLPKLAAVDKAHRDEAIRQAVADGATTKEVARLHGLSMRQVRNVLREEKAPEETSFPKACNEGRRHSIKEET